ncbi:MAG: non-heme iron oxygenase ferredoxin subunit [gamma proteobacterium symbiont of Ctena orbiculata]|uniref:Non-heme iron oxygenase ferredoxin subunit n=1 Tax=Candidatus Thiodiazotropha taylori TaxID=2792791 RepID=A0A944QW05_9GAMM|nr:non-heme iron oxygenase ferredoxin subunit [Candidatus Thiodiazotropha taylori]PUB83062.1 MAG: non-heme iron oxygenase ferredoxin subunit [gamma proteobacterium symbiont of Ctena orbiculata]MBT2990544.1 non-heme iron oxygenase ferredoxin subunit [Candidatus Thiodiazotropha taylori]MBT2998161.1 non-heme iron oxygenase ferredoxin subunit [Candidatus Thiodiazotropha taylori]MBT3002460.1 non-heme iron oxygenase ferredoxin subunit [Candidatus Thiodiazotropha taylori]
MAEWFEVARRGELPPGTMKRVELAGRRYLLANANGRIYAVDDLCSHEEVSLYLGCLEGDTIKCSLHGSRFSLISGEPLDEPATEPINTHPVKVSAERIYLLAKSPN